jgi:UDP-N-acetylmuramate: L-alanyl-gamma-D-glutamyl-meso-diaminopimelate ligase
VLASIFKSEAIPEAERLNLDLVIERITQQGRPAQVISDADSIVAMAAPEMRPGDVVAILSNGGFGGIYEKLPQRLRLIAANAAAANQSKTSTIVPSEA